MRKLLRNLLSKSTRRAVEDNRKAPTLPVGKKPNVLDALGPIVDNDVVLEAPNMFATATRRNADDYPTVDDLIVPDQDEELVFAFDAKTHAKVMRRKAVMDDVGGVTGSGDPSLKQSWSAYTVPSVLQAWYVSQSFIGYQACAYMAQHWLVDKACTMPGEDAVRNGYELALADAADGSVEKLGMDPDQFIAKMRDADNDHKITEQLVQYWRFIQIYGVRVCIPVVESTDPRYYEKPFNIDGVTKGSYKGIKPVDPYWMMPVLTGQESGNPTDLSFYDPSYWIIGGKKYHRSHLIIGRGPQPADILKPTYLFGGIPLAQRIYERVYNAERTANEGPLLAMTKRLTTLKVDIAKAEANKANFMRRLLMWTAMRDNHGVKTIDHEDALEQTDISLADLDSVIMTQYQLVAAIAEVPATKLLGTSPKGFNATGEFESKSYHERLESIQKNYLSAFLAKHHQLLSKSMFGVDIDVETVWNRVDSFSAAELADINAKKTETGDKLIAAGVISPDEERNRLKNDPLSGYNHLTMETAETEIGASPENKTAAETAQAKETTAGAAMTSATTPAPTDGNGITQDLETIRGLLDRASAYPERMEAGLYADLASVQHLLNEPGVVDSLDAEDIKGLLIGLQKMFQHEDNMGGLPGNTVDQDPFGRQPRVRRFHEARQRGSDGNQAGLPDTGGSSWSHRAMPKIRLGRLTVVVENPVGSIRSGTTLDGQEWRNQMTHHYGFIANTLGADGDEVDAFVGPNRSSRHVYVINQIEPTTGQFDEHKVMFGFDSEEAAVKAYHDNYQKGWAGFHSVVHFDQEAFRRWLREGDTAVTCVIIADEKKKSREEIMEEVNSQTTASFTDYTPSKE